MKLRSSKFYETDTFHGSAEILMKSINSVLHRVLDKIEKHVVGSSDTSLDTTEFQFRPVSNNRCERKSTEYILKTYLFLHTNN